LEKSYSFFILLSLPWGGEPRRYQTHAFVAIGVQHHDDPAHHVEAKRDESSLMRMGVFDGDRMGIDEHAFGVPEADPVLPEIRPSLGRIPDRRHICLICICLVSVKFWRSNVPVQRRAAQRTVRWNRLLGGGSSQGREKPTYDFLNRLKVRAVVERCIDISTEVR
jgi:hypothetical protein